MGTYDQNQTYNHTRQTCILISIWDPLNSVKTATKFIFVKPADNCTKDSLRKTHTKEDTMPCLVLFQQWMSRYMDYLKSTPLEHVPLDTEMDLRDLDQIY